MKIIKTNEVPKIPITNPIFTEEVLLQNFVSKDISQIWVIQVHFNKGARTKFHTHSSVQVLLVTSGKGIVATDKEKIVVETGDMVHIAPGEKHWHGANNDHKFSHIAIMASDSSDVILE